MSKNTKDILDKIKESGIKPKPRWQFVFVNFLLIVAVITAVVMGGLVMSLIYLKLFNLDWEFVSIAGERGLPPVFEVLPLIWIVLLLLVLILSVWAFEKTEGGYKYSPVWVVVGSVFVSMLLAAAFYAVNGAETADNILRSTIPAYEKWEERREGKFHLPELGGLPGQVLDIPSEWSFHLRDLKNNTWTVEVIPASPAQKKIRDLHVGQMIFALGKQKESGVFEARDLRLKKGPVSNLRQIMSRDLKEMGAVNTLDQPGRPFKVDALNGGLNSVEEKL